MHILDKRSKIVLSAVALAVAFVWPYVNPITAFAATGAPNVGDFTEESLKCGQIVDEETIKLQLTGELRAGELVVARLATDPGWPKLSESSVTVMVDGAQKPLLNNEFQFGSLNAPTNVVVQVEQLPAGQPMHVELRQASGTMYGHLVTGWIDQADC